MSRDAGQGFESSPPSLHRRLLASNWCNKPIDLRLCFARGFVTLDCDIPRVYTARRCLFLLFSRYLSFRSFFFFSGVSRAASTSIYTHIYV